MTREEIISMAQAAWLTAGEGWVAEGWLGDRADAFEEFARKVEARAASAEREACAQICDFNSATHPACGKPMTAEELAYAIRARGAA